MTAKAILTARWNNRFTLGLGLIFFSFIAVAVFTAALPAGDAFTGLVLIGCMFWIFTEGHLALRFVWEKKQSDNRDKVKPGCGIQLFRLVYNAAWLLPIALTFGGTLDYTTGFTAFTTICIVRLIANLYANNVLNADQFNVFLFRAWMVTSYSESAPST